MMTSVGSSASQVSMQRSMTSGSSWNEGTTTLVVVRKSLTSGRYRTDISLRTSQTDQLMTPMTPIGRNSCQWSVSPADEDMQGPLRQVGTAPRRQRRCKVAAAVIVRSDLFIRINARSPFGGTPCPPFGRRASHDRCGR